MLWEGWSFIHVQVLTWLGLTAHADVIISLPTFIIAECVLIYLDPDSSRAIVGWASRTFSTSIFFLYEQVVDAIKLNLVFFYRLTLHPFNLSSNAILSQGTVDALLMYCNDLLAYYVAYWQIHPDDAFGQQMIRNLEVFLLIVL